MPWKMPVIMAMLSLLSATNALAGTSCGPQSMMGRWVPDYFSTPMSPEQAQFARACDAHDQCYGYLGVAKEMCDADFARHLRLECDWAFRSWQDEPSRMACYMVASVYVANVRQFGDPYFVGAQQGAIMRLWMHRQLAQGQSNTPTQLPVTRGDVHGR